MALIDNINKAIETGMTVKVATACRVTPVKAKHVAQWAAAGYEFFKTDAKGATLMIDGQSKGKPRYACIDFCKITAS